MPFVDARGIRIFHRFDGKSDSPVLVLSNSLGTDMAMWDPQIPAFAERFRVLRYDSRGHGQSAVPPGPYRIEDLGRDLLALLDALGLSRVHYCGLSKGGMVGMWLGVNAPDRVERLVLCNTSAYLGSPELWNARIEAVRRSGMQAVVPQVLERWFTADFRAREPEAVEKVRRMLLATPPEGYAACSAAIRDMDQREAIAAIRAPALVVVGASDPATPPEHGRQIAERIRGSRVVELPAAHLSNVEAKDGFSSAVLEFLGA
ncbi:MAG: 3-oxoadipate enol-lactonase [Myxococcales bacterium]